MDAPERPKGYCFPKPVIPYVKALQLVLEPHAKQENALPMRAYMKNQFAFLGIKTPERKTILQDFIASHGLPEDEELEGVVLALWQLPEREYHYLALDLLERLLKNLAPERLALLERLIVTKSWWDTVDTIASRLVGGMLLRHPEAREAWIGRWRTSDNLWLRRSTLLFQLRYKGKTDETLLFELVVDNLGSKEFFIDKAIGWALREYSKTNAEAVRTFVATTPLAPLSRREALKWLSKQGKAPPS